MHSKLQRIYNNFISILSSVHSRTRTRELDASENDVTHDAYLSYLRAYHEEPPAAAVGRAHEVHLQSDADHGWPDAFRQGAEDLPRVQGAHQRWCAVQKLL